MNVLVCKEHVVPEVPFKLKACDKNVARNTCTQFSADVPLLLTLLVMLINSHLHIYADKEFMQVFTFIASLIGALMQLPLGWKYFYGLISLNEVP